MRWLLLDTNLLVAWVIGRVDPAMLARHKRAALFDSGDLPLLISVVDRFDQVVTIPHVLAEASNLLGLTGEPDRTALLEGLGRFISETHEIQVLSATAVDHASFAKLGLADAAILCAANKQVSTMTTDFHLCGVLQKQGLPSINFNHLRSANWLDE